MRRSSHRKLIIYRFLRKSWLDYQEMKDLELTVLTRDYSSSLERAIAVRNYLRERRSQAYEKTINRLKILTLVLVTMFIVTNGCNVLAVDICNINLQDYYKEIISLINLYDRINVKNDILDILREKAESPTASKKLKDSLPSIIDNININHKIQKEINFAICNKFIALIIQNKSNIETIKENFQLDIKNEEFKEMLVSAIDDISEEKLEL